MSAKHTMNVPSDLQFSDLKLVREQDGSVSFDWSAIDRICAASGLEADRFRNSAEDNVAGLIVAWYQAHRREGGEPDAVAEDLLSEVRLEDQAGQFASLPPGRA